MERNRIKMQILAEEEMRKDAIYRQKINHVDQVIAVECFKLQRSRLKHRSPLTDASVLSDLSFAPTVGSRTQL